MVTMTKPEWVCQRILAIYRYKARVEPNFGLGINDKFKEALIDTIYCLFSKTPEQLPMASSQAPHLRRF